MYIFATTKLSSHGDDSPESSLSALHMIECLCCIGKGELLYHTFHIVNLRELNCLFTIKGMT